MNRSFLLTVILLTAFSSIALAKNNVVTKYYSDGTILSRQVYYPNGAHKGPDKFYWPNGRLRLEYIYTGGQLSKTLRWLDDGTPVTN
jgi:antitoxin component YwqK of YwqJK toxin-antitoxin module